MRGVFHTKNETLNDQNYNRLHVICGESNCSQFQTWLKTGTMMIVMAMLDAGKCPGDELKLKSAVTAMREIAADPTCTATFACENGKPDMSALDIQYFYLEMAEGLLTEPFMPEWAGNICRAWRQTLDALGRDPSLLAGRLDWVLKKQLFERQIERHPMISAEDVLIWNSVVNELDGCLGKRRNRGSSLTSRFVLSQAHTRGLLGDTIRKLTLELEQHGWTWDQLDAFMRLRFELCEFDMRFSELGSRGLFETLDKAGVLDHRIIPDDECDRAIMQPPSQGRAHIRGRCISRLASENRLGYGCTWDRIFGPTTILNLGDPFETEENWREIPEERRESVGNFELAQDFLDIPAFLREQRD